MDEIWKDIQGYEGLYQVSNLGRVKSLGHDLWHKGRIIKPHFDGLGKYLFVQLYKMGASKKVNVHRLVAIAFVPNPNNLPQVNHKDENKTNNNANNLEWCDASYNIRYGTAMKRAIETRRKNNDIQELVRRIKRTKILNNTYSCERPVNQFTWGGKFVARYISATEAMNKTGVQHGCISRCCKWLTKRAGNFIWLYDEDVDKIEQRILDAHPNAKKIGQYSTSGQLIKIWNSAKEACDVLGVNKASLSECCHGKRGKARGSIWKFIEENY